MRVLLALGGCVGMVASRAIIRDLYPPEEMAKVFSTLMLIMGAAPILAPTAGSFIVGHFGWRGIFLFLTIFTLALWLTVYFFLPESRAPDPSVKLNPAAVATDYRIVMRNREFAVYGIAGGLSMAALFSYITGAPLLFLKILGMDPTHFAWLFGANALGFISAAQLNRVVLRFVTPQKLVVYAGTVATLVAVGILAASWLNVTHVVVYAALIFCFMSALGPLVPNTTALALAPFKKFAGSASALNGSKQMLLAAMATAAVSAAANGTAIPMGATMLVCVGVGLAIVSFGPRPVHLTATA
jgi:DHA1 family bicyclomycin/chloramphenicol resistance-like MFS transporter